MSIWGKGVSTNHVMINSWQINVINSFWIHAPKFLYVKRLPSEIAAVPKCPFQELWYSLQFKDFSSTFNGFEFLRLNSSIWRTSMNPVNNLEPIWHMFRPGDTDPSLLPVYFSQSSKQSKQYAPLCSRVQPALFGWTRLRSDHVWMMWNLTNTIYIIHRMLRFHHLQLPCCFISLHTTWLDLIGKKWQWITRTGLLQWRWARAACLDTFDNMLTAQI